MDILDLLQASPAWLVTATSLLGLIVGSFLNVVVHRLPRMLERAWKQECQAFLGLESSDTPEAAFSLVAPGSRCPHCGHGIRAHENIPILSYVFLQGRCAACGAGISIRYPAIEALTGIVSGVVAWQMGPTGAMLAALCLSWTLIALSAIDLEKQLLPDAITLPFLWLGLLLSLSGSFTDPRSSIIGAAVGYLSLWSVYQAFRLLTGKEGMGFGDFKLLALFGAWLGWQKLLPIILMASLVGAVVGTCMIAFLRHQRSAPIPFGPYLAAAGWIVMLWGDPILDAYLRFAGLAP
ncbi:prepilin peptidase [Methyloterricola oryzae]|uniref:prepilin peptidase n=1 Tax=Methyloterricola oryzae TaxID=1495050 RepID=UPI0005EAEC3A|nr:A24 family peptidase [Methyloterricola oryzae]